MSSTTSAPMSLADLQRTMAAAVMMPLTAGDKEVQFNVRTGARLTETLVHAVFNPKEMIYRGALAV